MNYICKICKTRVRQGHVFLMGAQKVTVTSITQNFMRFRRKEHDGTTRVIRHTVNNLQSSNPKKNKLLPL